MEKLSVVHRLRRRDGPRPAARWALPFLLALFLATPLAGPVLTSVARPEHPLPRPRPAPTLILTSGHVAGFDAQLRARYASLGAEQQGLRFAVFEQALTGFLNLRQQGKVPARQQRLAVIDFDLPSTEKRLWVLDLVANQVLYRSLVAHGTNSGQLEATRFSNLNGSNASSLGFYVTGQEYVGKHGRSLRLNGLDPGFNDQAAARAIVVHGADYVSEAFIRQNGRLGRSQGCPALPLELYEPIIDTLKGGAGLFVHKSGAGYSSVYLNEQQASAVLPGVAHVWNQKATSIPSVFQRWVRDPVNSGEIHVGKASSRRPA
ncbi:murein L,D-transpeptidase catalytic domain family protein [Hymenobacter lutimineralis]|uniref:Murein L,D-transpeptidase catalytic domain family protein n=1 Tax=Hymenobacter lutimineralis TaxID=2606448 RepID=A0A5D6UWJ9_9BACT|nr:murein L,D-transpeptidase catalytic domain family protein [Hymenobacter lutimineralis]TYZ07268.1 murein L,D-transpeptidase catalytic domain family protein [Hymenobacter lutimineralis]